MKNLRNVPLKLLSLNIPKDIYQEIKEICVKRETTMTMFILGAIIRRLKQEGKAKE